MEVISWDFHFSPPGSAPLYNKALRVRQFGLGRPVVWTCREDAFDELHFDAKPYNFVRWSNSADLREKLGDRVQATIPR